VVDKELFCYKFSFDHVDSKICGGAMPASLDEIAFNAVAVGWNSQEAPITVCDVRTLLIHSLLGRKPFIPRPGHASCFRLSDGHIPRPLTYLLTMYTEATAVYILASPAYWTISGHIFY